MLTIGDKLPAFDVQAVVSLEKGKEFQQVTNASYKGQWIVLFYWPMDFTFICPTEIAEFGKRNRRLQGPRTPRCWARARTRTSCTSPGARTTTTSRTCPSPCSPTRSASWPRRSASSTSRRAWRCAPRSSSIPKGVIRWVSVNDLSVGRNVPEVLRVLDGLQTDELCPCNWEKGEPTLQVA